MGFFLWFSLLSSPSSCLPVCTLITGSLCTVHPGSFIQTSPDWEFPEEESPSLPSSDSSSAAHPFNTQPLSVSVAAQPLARPQSVPLRCPWPVTVMTHMGVTHALSMPHSLLWEEVSDLSPLNPLSSLKQDPPAPVYHLSLKCSFSCKPLSVSSYASLHSLVFVHYGEAEFLVLALESESHTHWTSALPLNYIPNTLCLFI